MLFHDLPIGAPVVDVVLDANSILEIFGSDGNIEVYTITGIKLYDGNMNDLMKLPTGIYVLKNKVVHLKL